MTTNEQEQEQPLNPTPDTPETKQEAKAPTQKEIYQQNVATKNYYKQQIEALKPQVELMEMRERLSSATLKNYQNSIELNRIQNGFENQKTGDPVSKPETFDHTVTQEDLDQNPEMGEQGIKLGDIVQVRERTTPAITVPEVSEEKNPAVIAPEAATDKANELYEGNGND